MVDSDWGGTPIEAWSSTDALEECGIDQNKCDEEHPERCSSRLCNEMINPLKKASIKGLLWYQGESNGGNNLDQYNFTFPAMIKSWRQP